MGGDEGGGKSSFHFVWSRLNLQCMVDTATWLHQAVDDYLKLELMGEVRTADINLKVIAQSWGLKSRN